MKEVLDRLRVDGSQRISSATTLDELDALRVSLLGRKGEVTLLLRGLKDVPAEQRPAMGAELNRLKLNLSSLLEDRASEFAGSVQVAAGDRLDLTLPAPAEPSLGVVHPLTSVLESICDIFYGMGFSRGEGPEVELDYYNFTALNFPDDHPARDIQDTFYINDQVCLRTQTSPVQVRTMEKQPPPLACIFPGRVYRNENADASHSSEFYQIEGLVVDTDISMADLKSTVDTFVQLFFGAKEPTRFRPHFFPFTEPSVEVDFSCHVCGGKGCRVCKMSGWIEIAGAGMVDPRVYRLVGYDPEQVYGYAFGFGVERIAMIKYGIPDIRWLYENDTRFLSQLA